MSSEKQQYHIYNEHMSFLVTVPAISDEYAEGFAKRVAMDFYDYTEDQVKNVNVQLITNFRMEAAINLKMLNQ